VRIAKSSKEQDGYEAPDTTGARLSPGPEGARKSSSGDDKKISKTQFGFKSRGHFFWGLMWLLVLVLPWFIAIFWRAVILRCGDDELLIQVVMLASTAIVSAIASGAPPPAGARVS
jgi:hypothetical protein